jgi:hypothetical protein
MLFFNPSAYEEFVYRLASLRVKPPAEAWSAIIERQNSAGAIRRRLLITRLSVAASIAAIVGLGAISFQLSVVNPNLSFSQEKGVASSNGSLLPVLTDPFTRSLAENPIIKHRGKPVVKLTDQEALSVESRVEEPIDNNQLKRIGLTERNELMLLSEVSSNNILINTKENALPVAKPTSKSTYSNKWIIYTSLAPAYSYHTQGFSDFSYYSNEQGAWLWTGEVIAKRRVNKRVSVHTGLTLSPSGQTIGNVVLLTSSKVNKDMKVLKASTVYGRVSLDNQIFGVINPGDVSSTPNSLVKNSALNQAKLSQRLYYIEVPFMLSFSMFDKSSEFEFKLGGSAGFLLINQFVLKGNQKKFYGKTEGVNPFNASFIASICFSNAINKDISLHLEPSFRLNTNPLSYNEMNTYPFSTSIKVGVSYNIR